MSVNEILEQLDTALNNNDLDLADKILTDGIRIMADSGDSSSLLQLLNEYIGFLRTMGRFDEAYAIGDNIRKLLDAMGLAGSIPYATSLLNIATAYRAGGRYEDSLSLYNETEQIYLSSLPENSMLTASFYNNKSLLFQEMGNLEESIECLEKALKIVVSNDEKFEIAVTYTNLSNSNIGLHKYAEAYNNAIKAINAFDEINVHDSHYASALYAIGVAESYTGNVDNAKAHLKSALNIMEENLGKNEYYYRILDELKRIKAAYTVNQPVKNNSMSGMEISRAYYEELVKPGINDKFAAYADKIAVGLVGRGSDCYMYDDEASMDHDWGPGVCIFVTDETYALIGKELDSFYASLPNEFMGYKRAPIVSRHKRKGVFTINEFYKEILGIWPISPDSYADIPDYALSAAVNGQVFTDPEGIFTSIRNDLLKGYPDSLRFRKIADSAAKFSQASQYNFARMLKRGDTVTASIMMSDGIKEAMKLAHYIENKYTPHDKWLFKSLESLKIGPDIIPLIKSSMKTGDVSMLAGFLAETMYSMDLISDIDDYLDHHTDELIFKSFICDKSEKELVKKIVELEFEAFDKVENEGGRANCQDDWITFSKMRMSQYLTWNKPMLMQYLYDFDREYKLGHNLITEKYGRMMASTAPSEYNKIKDNFPYIAPEKNAVIEAIVSIQVSWMEDFALRYPKLAGKARSIHSFEDTPYNTSYETYLRGEIQTYSDKMLQMYGTFIRKLTDEGLNLAEETMLKNCELYGYKSLDAAEEKA